MKYAMLVVVTILILGGVGFLLAASAQANPPPPPPPPPGGCQCGTQLQMKIMRHLDLAGGGGATGEAEDAGSEEIIIPAGGTYDLPELYTKGSGSAYVDIFIEPVEPSSGPKCSYQVSTTSTHNALSITYPDGRTEHERYCPPGIRRAFVGGTRPHGETFLGGRDVPSSGSATWTASLRCAPQCSAFPCCGGCTCATGQFTINIVK